MAAENVDCSEIPLPRGWIKSTSKKFNKTYYYHENTKCSIWVHPALLYEKDGDDTGKSLVTTGGSSTSADKGDEDVSFFSRSENCTSIYGGKTRSSSSILNHLGLYGKVKSPTPQRRSSESASLTKEQCFQLIKEADDADKKAKQRSPINRNEDQWSKILNQRDVRSTQLPDKLAKRNLSRNHPYHQKQHAIQQQSEEGYSSMGNNSEKDELNNNWTLNIASTNHTFISINDKSEQNIINSTVKATLKPLPQHSATEPKQNRKRRSSEGIEFQEPETLCKVTKLENKEKTKILTPAMKAVLAKRELSKYTKDNNETDDKRLGLRKLCTEKIDHEKKGTEKSGYRSKRTPDKIKSENTTCNREVELVKSRAKKIDIGNKLNKKPAESSKGCMSKPTPAMLAIMKYGNTYDAETAETSQNEKETKQIEKTKCEDGILDRIWKTCVSSFRKKLKPLKPSQKVKKNCQETKEPIENLATETESDIQITGKTQKSEENCTVKNKKYREIPILESQKPGPSFANVNRSESNILFQNYPISHGEVEDMEVDDFQITQGIRELRDDIVFEKPGKVVTNQQPILPVYSDLLYIVLDTNVLLSNLKFISELKDIPVVPDVGPPTLIIPWIVFQELDSLKDAVKRFHVERSEVGNEKSRNLSTLARKAISFIGSCLDGGHPRLKGQSAIEAGTPIKGFSEESNDDSILHCALGLKTRSVHSHIVILSNDRNLLNKAIINEIRAFSLKNIMLGLKKMFNDVRDERKFKLRGSEIDCTGVHKENLGKSIPPKVNRERENIVDDESVKNNKADELSCELQCILRNDFSKIIEIEMISAYGIDLWLDIVKIKPPWTLEDTFTLFEKHWIAVFGMLVKRSIKQKINELKEKYLSAKTSSVDVESVKTMLKLSLTILDCFQSNSDYNGMISVSIKKINRFLSQIDNLSNSVNISNSAKGESTNELNSPNQSYTSQTSSQCVKEIPINSDLSSSNVSKKELTTYEKVRLTFDDIWNTGTLYSALVFASLNFPSPLVKNLDPQQAIPPKPEALMCLSVMTPCILNLVKSIHKLLSIPESFDIKPNVLEVMESISVFSLEVMKRDCTISPDDLLVFCLDSNTKDIFIQGLGQLDRLYAMLLQCKEFHQTTGC